MRRCPSPNHDARAAAVDMIVLHYTDMADADAALARLTDPRAKVSAHYLVRADGGVIQLVDEARRAWHAGRSHWDGAGDCNSRSIGIELDSPGHRPAAPDFCEPQIAALIELVAAIRDRWGVPRRNVVGHSDIAPERKIDPGERFPWSRLAAAGHALWVPPQPPRPPGAADPARLAAALERAGYALAGGRASPALIDAFHRRHLPQRLGRPADGATLATAEAFAAAVAADRAGGLSAASAR